MNRSLLHHNANKQMLKRIALLTPATVAKWGTMDAAAMLRHCRIVAETILARQSPDESPTLKQLMLRTLVLHIMRRLPKGRQQPKVIAEAMAAQPSLSFEEERQHLAEITSRFANYGGVLSGRHPVFGPMRTAHWGAFAWLHLDHHLRQFGV